MRSVVRPRGRVVINVGGRLIFKQNLLMTLGLQRMAERMAGLISVTLPSHIACGDSNTLPLVEHTTLQGTEHIRNTVTTTQVENTVTYSATFNTFGSSLVVREFGLFNASPGGDMFARVVTPDINVNTNSDMDIDWSITFAAEDD